MEYSPVSPKAIFVSSTFRDMQTERDVLRDVVLPAVNAFAERYGSQVELIDLRWGVDTGGVSETEQNAKVLHTCLDEIKRSRPFFIGLLGDRYGWVPPEAELAAAAGSAEFDMTDLNKSVTALEIEYGALRSAGKTRSLFYFRNLDYSGMDEEFWPAYRDTGEALEKQDRLKADIRAAFGTNVKTYTAHFADGYVQRLNDFAVMLTADIVAMLRQEWGEAPPEVPGREAALETELSAFRKSKAHHLYMGLRQQVFLDGMMIYCLEDLSDGEEGEKKKKKTEGRIVLLQGESGCGKSTILCKLMDKLEDKCLLLPFVCGISARTSSIRGMFEALIARLERFLAAAGTGVPRAGGGAPDTDAAAPPTNDDLCTRFWDLVSLAAEQTVVVLLLDSIDRLARDEMAQNLLWVQTPLPPNINIICTMTDGPEAAAFEILGGEVMHPWDEPPIQAKGLDEDEAESVIAAAAQKKHKQLSPEVVRHIVGKKCYNPLYLDLTVQDLVMMDRYEHRAIDELVRGGLTPMDAINRFMKSRIDQTEASPQAAVLSIISRAESLIGQAFVRTVLCGLAASRHGLREKDLQGLCRHTGLSWDAAAFSWLRQLMGGQFVQGEDLRWDFSHQNTRQALQVYGDTIHDANLALCRCFYEKALSDPFICGEILHHLHKAGLIAETVTVIGEGEGAYAGILTESWRELCAGLSLTDKDSGGFIGAVLRGAGGQSEKTRARVAQTVLSVLDDDVMPAPNQSRLTSAVLRLLESEKAAGSETLALIYRTYLKLADCAEDDAEAPAGLRADCIMKAFRGFDALYKKTGNLDYRFEYGDACVGYIWRLIDAASENDEKTLKVVRAIREKTLPALQEAAFAQMKKGQSAKAEKYWLTVFDLYYTLYETLDWDEKNTADDSIAWLKQILKTARRVYQNCPSSAIRAKEALGYLTLSELYALCENEKESLQCAISAHKICREIYNSERSVKNRMRLLSYQSQLSAVFNLCGSHKAAYKTSKETHPALEIAFAQSPNLQRAAELAQAYVNSAEALEGLEKQERALVYAIWAYAVFDGLHRAGVAGEAQVDEMLDECAALIARCRFEQEESRVIDLFAEILDRFLSYAAGPRHGTFAEIVKSALGAGIFKFQEAERQADVRMLTQMQAGFLSEEQ